MKVSRCLTSCIFAAGLGAAGCGCGRDVRLAGKNVRHVQVTTVSLYGMDLNQSATPEQVAYAALRAIRDDFFAPDKAAREAALDAQFDIAAADVIAARNRTSLQRDEYIHHVVNLWTPTVSHYAADFEMEPEKALARFKNRGTSRSAGGDTAECELAMEVADPAKDPAASAVLLVKLAKDAGFWRVVQLGFEPRRTLTTTTGSAATPPAGG